MRAKAAAEVASPRWIPWYERLDVSGAREFVPSPSTPRGGDQLLENLAILFERVTVVPLSAFLLVGSPRTVLRGLTAPDALVEEWSFYSRPEHLADPDGFFPAPEVPDDIEVHEPDRVLWAPADAHVVDVRFPSTFEPANPALAAEYLADVSNRVVHARWWRHRDAPRPTVVCVHGFQAGSNALNTLLFDIPWLFGLGVDVVQFLLPFHGARATAVDGWNYLSLDVARMAEAVAHSIWDLRGVIGFLLREGAPAVGVTGVSLGGYVTSLIAGIDARLAFAVPVSPATSMADLLHDLAPLSPVVPLFLRTVGWELDDVRTHMAVHTPLQHTPKLPPERLLIVGAVRDRLTHPYHQRLLWEHWGAPQTFWHAGAHQLHLHRREFRGALAQFLIGVGAVG